MELLTLEEAANKLKVSVRTVRLYCSEDRIPFVRLGRKSYRIKASVIDDIINGVIEIGPKK